MTKLAKNNSQLHRHLHVVYDKVGESPSVAPRRRSPTSGIDRSRYGNIRAGPTDICDRGQAGLRDAPGAIPPVRPGGH